MPFKDPENLKRYQEEYQKTYALSTEQIEHRREYAKEYAKRNREKYKERNKTNHILRTYGLNSEEYEALISDGCEICGTQEDLCVDHDHETGKVRGCLCRKHNSMLGFADDQLEILEAAMAYLRKRC